MDRTLRMTICRGAGAAMVVAALLIQFRFLSIALCVLFCSAYFIVKPSHRKWLVALGCAAIAVSMFLPFDVALGSYTGGLRLGRGPRGPHFVRVFFGFRNDNQLVGRYGEIITSGGAPSSLVPPKWILVWN